MPASHRFILIVATLSFFSAAQKSFAVISDDDGRIESFQASTPMLQKMADSTVALIYKKDFREMFGSVHLKKLETLGEARGACKTERFVSQPTNAFCSGALVGPDLVLTAGHCLTGELTGDVPFCRKHIKFVFGYQMNSDQKTVRSIPTSEVYDCENIVTISADIQSNDHYYDFALVKLTRKVTNHQPLLIDRSGVLADLNTKLTMIGYPNGIPQKIDLGGTVKTSLASQPFFVANLDSIGGNSGSPIFDEKSGLIIGVLGGKVITKRNSGDMDYIATGDLSCTVENRVASSNTLGDLVTRISEITSSIPSL